MERSYKFNKSYTQIAKGMAILLMLIHHLFAFPTWITEWEYISLFSIRGNEIEYLIGVFRKICVGMYLFLSGYGLYKIYDGKKINYRDIINRALKFLMNYWIILLIFVSIGFMFFSDKFQFNLVEFIKNILTLSSTYNSTW